ncbi:MAG TPA: LytTR family DNA-binding domain-containing protein [Longimicrobium sp.]|jgi:two-component system LytT family response regulator|uniref:LytR/AlgR family response regulator transcription factor n=1 Tax=Longimicrobium sp. TaxID=2029185 RepID=UPI002EDAB03B
MNPRIRVLIVDDEAPARLLLNSYLAAEPDVEVVGMCGTAAETVAHLRARETDAVFLDIRLADGTGFDVLDQVGPEVMPPVVFVTAYDEHAIRAFELHAIDYLLKPVAEARFRAAVARLRELLSRDAGGGGGAREAVRAARELLAGATGSHSAQGRGYLAARTASGVQIVPVATVRYLRVDGHYVTIHSASGTHLVRGALSDFEDELDAGRFVRIHRSTIVNLDFVRELKPWFRGDYLVLLLDGTELRLSRRFRANLSRRFVSDW